MKLTSVEETIRDLEKLLTSARSGYLTLAASELNALENAHSILKSLNNITNGRAKLAGIETDESKKKEVG